MAFVIPMGTVSSSIYVWEFPDIMKFLRFVAVCIWPHIKQAFIMRRLATTEMLIRLVKTKMRPDPIALMKKNAEFMNNESLSDTRLDE